MGNPPDFSAVEYWTERFADEKQFEWLGRSDVIVPLVANVLRDLIDTRRLEHRSDGPDKAETALNILHFGCGSSTLGPDLQSGLSALIDGHKVQVIDADYVDSALLPPRTIPVIQLDVLDRESLKESSQQYGEWDVLIDKSTADAISCGPNPIVDGTSLEPVEVLCSNLARITKKGGKWVCVSYSATRFSHLSPGLASTSQDDTAPSSGEDKSAGWALIERRPLGSMSLPEGRKVKDGKGWRTVYEPETPVWVYILERT